MKILILTFYYQPDLSAGSFRSTALVEQLIKLGLDIDIEVITTLPNRYASFHPDAPAIEEFSRLKIHRVKLPPHQSGIKDQARAFMTYAHAVKTLTQQSKYDLVFATSSRLMTAVLGSWVARKNKIPLYLDIRDLFVDTISDILSKGKSLLAMPCFTLAERWAFNYASRINLVSSGFKSYFDEKYDKKELRFFTNGIDDEFVSVTKKVNNLIPTNPSRVLTVVYAGNIGEGQGLHNIIPALAKRLENRVIFKILGDGGKKKLLQEALKAESCTNVEILEPVARKGLMQVYEQADILFLHLNDYNAFKKVLPSKLFEYAALGKPIWAGVSGYAAEFIQKEISNASVFTPGNFMDAERALNVLSLELQNRDSFINKYARFNIMNQMAKDILALVN